MWFLLVLLAAILIGVLLFWRRPRGAWSLNPSPEIHRSEGGLRDGTSPYVLHVPLPGQGERARVPIHRALGAPSGLTVRERYWVDLLGVRIEAPNLPSLRNAVQAVYHRLLEGGPLPDYWIGIRRTWVPVFFREGRYTARIYDGPEVWGPSLSTIRDRLEAYFRAPIFGVLRVSRRDLGLHPPCGILEGPGVWIPVWRENGRFYLPAQEVDRIPEAADLATLYRHTAEALVREGRLGATVDLTLRWGEPLRGEVTPHALSVPFGIRDRLRLPVLRIEQVLGCQVDGLFVLADDLWTLREAAGRVLERAGRARADEVRLERTDSVEQKEALGWSGSGWS